MNNNQIDCLRLVEMNTYWSALSTQHKFQERTRGWFETTVSVAAYNRHNTNVRKQQGGTAIIARDQFAHRSHIRTYDQLVRWMIMSFQGKQGLSLRLISAYRPQYTQGTYTVYQQQIHYYSSINNGNSLIKIFDDDLCCIIEE